MQQLQSFRLPPETLDIVLTYLQKPDLVVVACTSSLLRSLVIRHLYKRLIGVRGKRLIQCLLALLRYDTGIIHVHELEIVLPGKMNFLQPILLLIHRVLIRLTNLRTLSFEFSPENVNDSLGWVLKGCTFSLYSLETSLPSGPALSAFLCTQTELKNLCLRGICRGVSFPLPLSAMPRLTSFRILDASPSVIRTIVMGRPVTRVTVSLATDQSMPIFSELRRSARPLERLTLMTLSVPDPATLISDVASCFPNLDSLHIYALLLPFEEVAELKNRLVQAAIHLKRLKSIRYLIFMAGGPSSQLPEEDEDEIASEWAAVCPNLRTIILPRGKVWFYKDSKCIHCE